MPSSDTLTLYLDWSGMMLLTMQARLCCNFTMKKGINPLLYLNKPYIMAVRPASPTTTRPKEAMLNGLKIPQSAASETLTVKDSVVCSSGYSQQIDPLRII